MHSISSSNRLHVVDALRGFAIVAIMLLHNIEHFDLYYTPENLPHWLAAMDKAIWDSLFFLFGGKAYAIFALLFGLTFYIQSHNEEKRGRDFRGRFAWRMFLLLLFGVLNSAFFEGDILMMYAVLGLFLIPVAKLRSGIVLAIAIFLLLLPLEWLHLYQALVNPEMPVSDPASWAYFGRMWEYLPNDSFLAAVKGNLTNGRIAVLLWSWENGRFFLILGLFMLGFLAGRRKLFVWSDTTRKFWIRALLIASVIFIPTFIVVKNLGDLVASDAIRRPLSTLVSTWSNTSFMVILVSGFTLLFQATAVRKPLQYFSAFGKMSLSNYVIQSIIGAFIYHGWGLGLYLYTGSTYALLIGIVLTILMGLFCKWWAAHFRQGPLEIIWHKATWIGTEK